MGVTVRPGLERRLKGALRGAVHFDAATRGRYATDASAYQVIPLGVVLPTGPDDVAEALRIAREEGVPVLPRGGGTSQCGQTVNDALVLDCSRHMNRILALDVAARRAVVEPGLVLDELNRALKPHGLWYPVDVSTASRATLGGMAGNNSCGSRSLRYGNMRENTLSIDAILPDGTAAHFGPLDAETDRPVPADLVSDLLALGAREADEILARFPSVQRRVGGYNLDALLPSNRPQNLAHLLVGSEGTLGFSTAIELMLSPLLPAKKRLGACHFGSFHEAMAAAQHIVKLGPTAVELVDATMIGLASSIAMFRPTLEAFVRGEPEALLLIEFAEGDDAENARRIAALEDLMRDLGFSWECTGARFGGVVAVTDARLQTAITELRTAGLNIMMSMKDERKPVSFVEDAAVPLEHLADYTARLTAVFEKHGTKGTWYAHAGSGCLHVRPVLNLKLEKDLAAMRAIAEEAFAMVREYKGSHSGEHGDGIVRSEFHRPMFGDRIVAAFESVKDRIDPTGLYNPGRIVRPPRMDDRTLLRYNGDYAASRVAPRLDWSEFASGARATPALQFQGAVEMCNNNGACRSLAGGVMCPSYRATREEKDVTRGRANTLRLALSGQLGPDAFASDAMAETMALCVGCKGCKRECPTGVDMARMKTEVQAARVAARGLTLRERLVAHLPAYAPHAYGARAMTALRNRSPALARLMERATGFAASRPLPEWSSEPFRDEEARGGAGEPVVLFADTFNRWFEPENLRDAAAVLRAGGYAPEAAKAPGRPLCCGRTYLAAGLVDRAREEARRALAALLPRVRAGAPVVGLEPSCILTLRDEWLALGLGADAREVAEAALPFESFVARNAERFRPAFRPLPAEAVLHQHCHSKAHGVAGDVAAALALVPELLVTPIESSCCGMAGSFGYQAETADVSKAMAELSLLPAVRKAGADTLVVANGTSCRHQIGELAARAALNPARVLAKALHASSG
ncbi:FAD-binding and (Fe-S)-binding domain-containing protein [Elioraea rosea]|uniref:FAD-binding and (Fe-S)-binding domain-containing protein n=1 Tax=Elioraea rosea TaxID=2492390 RepID=UPI001181D002|nr:FAD-binding and (Fe-S)-binding domain-containing protein [Elioraea rosea]